MTTKAKVLAQNLRSLYQYHPDSRLQTLWDATQLGVAMMPFTPLLSGIGISLVALIILKQRFERISRRPVNWAMTVVALGMVISAVLAEHKADAFLGLTNFLPFFIVFAALSELIQTPAQWRRIAWLIMWGSVPVVMIGLGQQFWGWAGHVQILGSIVDWMIFPTGNPPGRMASIFFSANVLASYLIVTLPLSLGLFVVQIRARTSRSLRSMTLPLTLLLIMGGNAIALVLTNSRNAWGVGIFVFVAFAVYLGWRWIIWLIAAVTGTIWAAAFAPSPLRDVLRLIVPAYFWARLTDQLVPNRPLADLRSTQWRFAWSLVQQRPWTGWGLRNFSLLYQAATQFFIGHPHNLVLMLAAETGLPTTLLLVSIVGWVVIQGSLRLRATAHIGLIEGLPEGDRLLLFTYLTTFVGCSLFSLLDVTLFDVRINLFGWLLLAIICSAWCHMSVPKTTATE